MRVLPVRLFSKPGCTACAGIKSQLAAKGVDFTVVDISKDYDGGMELVERGFRSVPVLEQNGDYLAGAELRELVAAY